MPVMPETVVLALIAFVTVSKSVALMFPVAYKLSIIDLLALSFVISKVVSVT